MALSDEELMVAISQAWGDGRSFLDPLAIFHIWGDGRSSYGLVAICHTWGDGRSFLEAMEAIFRTWGDGKNHALEGTWEEVEMVVY